MVSLLTPCMLHEEPINNNTYSIAYRSYISRVQAHVYTIGYNMITLLLLLLLLAAVTYNQVQPLRINYLATEFLPKLELYG